MVCCRAALGGGLTRQGLLRDLGEARGSVAGWAGAARSEASWWAEGLPAAQEAGGARAVQALGGAHSGWVEPGRRCGMGCAAQKEVTETRDSSL